MIVSSPAAALTAPLIFVPFRLLRSVISKPEEMRRIWQWRREHATSSIDVHLLVDPTVDADESQPHDKLFRNLGDGTFRDVTEEAGIVEFRYSQAVAIGDRKSPAHASA